MLDELRKNAVIFALMNSGYSAAQNAAQLPRVFVVEPSSANNANPTHYGDPAGGCMSDEEAVRHCSGACAPDCEKHGDTAQPELSRAMAGIKMRLLHSRRSSNCAARVHVSASRLPGSAAPRRHRHQHRRPPYPSQPPSYSANGTSCHLRTSVRRCSGG